MSEAKLETARRLFETFNAHGFGSEEARAFFDEALVFEEPPEQPAPRIARGRDEAAETFRQFDEAWDSHRSEPQEFIAVDDDRVLVLTMEHFRGRDGIEISQPCGNLLTFRDGKISRVQAFWEQANALKAAGIER